MAAPDRGASAPSASDSYMFPAVFWPLIGGFIAFVLLAVLIGWWVDPVRHGEDPNRDLH